MDGSSFLCILKFYITCYCVALAFFFLPHYRDSCPSTNIEPDIGFCLGNTKEESDHRRPKRKDFLCMTLLVG